LSTQIVAGRCRHRDQNHGGFLALKSVDGSNPSTLGQTRSEKIDLHVVGTDHEDILNADQAGPPLSVDPTLT
jgi:hypothetical protein